AVAVQEQLDALADEELAAVAVALDVLRPAPAPGGLEQYVELLEPGGHRGAVRRGRAPGGVERARERRHQPSASGGLGMRDPGRREAEQAARLLDGGGGARPGLCPRPPP